MAMPTANAVGGDARHKGVLGGRTTWGARNPVGSWGLPGKNNSGVRGRRGRGHSVFRTASTTTLEAHNHQMYLK